MLTPAPDKKILRKMDYISDQEGILRRYLRENDGWNGHLENAGNFIREILRNRKFNHIVVLGSGWLLDFPMKSILPYVEKITLVDVHFPPQILRKVKDYNQVECISADITGGYIRAIYEQLKTKAAKFTFPQDIPVPSIKPEKGKLVISLNLMNQLDILLVDYICKSVNCEDNEVMNFRKTLQESHIHMLQEHPFILITDYLEILINTEGKVLKEKELIFCNIPAGDTFQDWEWEFDTHGLYNTDADTRMKVKAVFSKEPGKL